jgi:hypothetical protein
MLGVNDKLGDRGTRKIKQSRHVHESAKPVVKKTPKSISGLTTGNGKKMKGKKESNGNAVKASGVRTLKNPPP